MKFWMRLAVSVVFGLGSAWISTWLVMIGEKQEIPVDPFNFGWGYWIASCWTEPVFWGLLSSTITFFIFSLVARGEKKELGQELIILAIFGAASFLLLKACPVLFIVLAVFFCFQASFPDEGRILWKIRNHGFVMVAGAVMPLSLSYGAVNGFAVLLAYIIIGAIMHIGYFLICLCVFAFLAGKSSGVGDDDIAVGLG